MSDFDVLHPSTDLFRSYVIEASAGTGKTFSIEHLVVRLILEQKKNVLPFKLSEILIVTFTNACVDELKIRIRSQLIKAIDEIENAIYQKETNHTLDYLQPIIEKGHADIQEAKRRLKRALFDFDNAHIYTIHGFSAKMLMENMLESNFSANTQNFEETLPTEELKRMIKDAFLTEVRPNEISPNQLDILFKSYRYDVDKLLKKLIDLILSPYDIDKGYSFNELFDTFYQAIQNIKAIYPYEKELLLDDFKTIISNYLKPKDDPYPKIDRFFILTKRCRDRLF